MAYLLGPDFAQDFPHLTDDRASITSPQSRQYNCIAWAAGDMQNWWDITPRAVWPQGAPRTPDIESLKAAFRTLGYVECRDGSPRKNFRKVALYARGNTWTHAARQLPDGGWTSKLGQHHDISHTDTQAIEGPVYGNCNCFMELRIPSSSLLAKLFNWVRRRK